MSGFGTSRCAFSGCENPCPRDEDYCCSGCEQAGGDEDAAIGALLGLSLATSHARRARADLRRHRFMVALVAVEASALAVIALYLAMPL